MEKTKIPVISLGLPVYNGENYLAQAIESVLQQTCGDFELIITDNASTDQTEAICLDYARRDARIRYYRRNENIGAAGNFNWVFSLACGTYFKWIAHDDRIAPEFLAKCLAAMTCDPSVVLSYPRVHIIDAQGQVVENYDFKLNTDAPSPHVRFGELVRGHRCFEVFGLIRRDALKKTALIGNYSHGDGVLLAHLALLGRFVEVPEYLLLARKHPEQSMYKYGVYEHGSADNQRYAEWFDPKNKNRIPLPMSRLLFEYCRVIFQGSLPLAEQIPCWRKLAQWAWRFWRVLGGEWKGVLKQSFGLADRRLSKSS